MVLSENIIIDLMSSEQWGRAYPARRVVTMVVLLCLRDHATEVRFKPLGDELKLTYKVGGEDFEMVPVPREPGKEVLYRIKVLAELDSAKPEPLQEREVFFKVGESTARAIMQIQSGATTELAVIKFPESSDLSVPAEELLKKILAPARERRDGFPKMLREALRRVLHLGSRV
jgi:type IV pilus assembly protein PilB